ncbi:MAG: ATP-dependent DNA ligase [Thermodesulfovibrionales bacterium]
MKFRRLVESFALIEATSRRLEMFEILSALFAEADEGEIDKVIYLCQGRLAPAFHGIEMGISEKLLLRAISTASGAPTRRVEEIYRRTGDIGLAAEELMAGRGSLSVEEVYGELSQVARASGKGSLEVKLNLLQSLLRALSPLEAKYASRFVAGSLRLGIGDPTVLEALALSAGERALRPELERAYNLCSDLGLVARTLRAEGMESLRRFRVRVGFPIRPALCERLPSPEEIIAKMGRVAVEAKYDGFRCQVHKDGGRVEIFSRNLERTTAMFPEIARAASEHVAAERAIFEGEALAYSEETGELFPFQVTIQRKRKHGIREISREYPLRFFAFDLLYADGEDFTERPYAKRREKLESVIRENPVIAPAEMFVTAEAGEIAGYFERAVERGLEGVVAKRLDAPYAAGARNYNWIKLKRSYRSELADTLDVVIVGYFRGRGARAALGLGGVLAAVYDPPSDTFKTISKIGSGFSDEELSELGKTLKASAIPHRHPRVDSLIEPDAWVEPRHVITVAADEITRSPSHTAGRDGGGAGYALRFPRAVSSIREDKNPEDANTVAEIAEMARRQRKVKVQG